MRLFIIMFVLILPLASCLSDHRFAIAQCRALCLDTFEKEIPNDERCRNVPDCFMCWETCDLLRTNFTIWGHMCDVPRICFPGCQTSCGFYRRDNNAISNEKNSDLTFPGVLKLALEGKSMLLKWARPQTQGKNAPIGHFTYVIMMKQPSSNWQEIKQTGEHQAIIDEHLVSRKTEFRLLAVNKHGDNIEQSTTFVSTSDFLLRDGPLNAPAMVSSMSWQPELVSLHYSSRHSGVEATVSWPAITQDKCKYEVTWVIAENAFEVTGRLYTDKTSANLTLWKNFLHMVQVQCYGHKGDIVQQSTRLHINTNNVSLQSSAVSKECKDTVKLEILLAVIGGLAIILLIVVICCTIKVYWRTDRKTDHNSNTQSSAA